MLPLDYPFRAFRVRCCVRSVSLSSSGIISSIDLCLERKSRRTIRYSAVVGLFKVAICRERVRYASMFRLGELFFDGVIEALSSQSALVISACHIPKRTGPVSVEFDLLDQVPTRSVTGSESVVCATARPAQRTSAAIDGIMAANVRSKSECTRSDGARRSRGAMALSRRGSKVGTLKLPPSLLARRRRARQECSRDRDHAASGRSLSHTPTSPSPQIIHGGSSPSGCYR